VREIKKLWPGTVMVSGKPRHSESNGGIERRNRTVEEKISNWMHENNSKRWAQSLPFIQWRCNTQIHRGIGNRTPYHLMFGQHPQVGISSLPISQELLESLATETEVNRCLGLDDDVPLEESRIISTSGAETIIESSFSITNVLNTMQNCSSYQTPTGKSENREDQVETAIQSQPKARYESFKTDLTGKFADILKQKGTLMKKGEKSYQGKIFQWKALGIRCGVCFSSVPCSINLLWGVMLMTDSLKKQTRKDPPELLLCKSPNDSDRTTGSLQELARKDPPELLLCNTPNDSKSELPVCI
jgi:hypothetical protein